MRSADQRRSIRLPVSPEQASAVLRVGRRSIKGTMVNESAGGFAVRVDQDSGITVGQVLLLEISSGRSRTRVTYAQRDEDGLFVGLQRLSDLQPAYAGSSGGGLWMFDRIRMRRPGGDLSWYLGGAMVVFGVILAATLWHIMASNQSTLTITTSDRSRLIAAQRGSAANRSVAVHTTTNANGSAGGLSKTSRAAERWLTRQARDAEKWVGGVSRTVAKTVPSSTAEAGQQVEHLTKQVQTTWGQLQDEVVLLLPQVADKLQLSPEQKAQIDSIVKTSRETVQQVYREADDKSSPEVWQKIDQVRKEAGEQALAQLTPKQQEMLVAMRLH